MNDTGQALFELLKAKRLELSKGAKVPAFAILSDRSLLSLVHEKPKGLADLERVYGMGQAKIDKFGAFFFAHYLRFFEGEYRRGTCDSGCRGSFGNWAEEGESTGKKGLIGYGK
jgi:hypothetical protein